MACLDASGGQVPDQTPVRTAPTMRRDGDDRGPRRGRVARRLARERLRARAGADGRALLDDLRDRERAAVDTGERPRRPRPRPRLSRRVPLHARGLSVDVPRPPLDDAPVRRLRHPGGDERALPLPHGARPDGALDRLRHAHAHGLRLRPRPLAGRGRPRRRRRRLARRHGDALRRHPARRRLDLDDDQLACGDRARLLRLRRRAAGRRRATSCAEPRRRTSSRSTSRRRSGSSRPSRRCGSWST